MGRILLVEDDPDLRPLIEDVLALDGHEVDAAPSLLVAQILLNANTYDLVLADRYLGDGSGLDIADMAKAQGIATLVVTGYPYDFPDQRLRQHTYIPKPLRALALLKEVKLKLGVYPKH
jgi:DNA-binding response OmpR family regulator